MLQNGIAPAPNVGGSKPNVHAPKQTTRGRQRSQIA